MAKRVPKLIPIRHDDYHAEYVGRTKDGRQFLLTDPFVQATADDPGREFLAVYLFDAKGRFLEARIDDLGVRGDLDNEKRTRLRDRRLDEIGEREYCDVKVALFKVERFGVEFGLIPPEPEKEVGNWWVILMPGDYMAFTEPWDGTYDT